MLSRFFAAVCTLLLAASVQAAERNAYDFAFESIDGGALPMTAFRGKVVMVVNTASFCGFTKQYKALQSLWQSYRDDGFVVLGVPSNDFGNQEPGKAAEIKKFCELNYGIDFPMTQKVHVKGKKAHPFYDWARSELGAKARPRWNFHKYLIGRDGSLVGWFETRTKPAAKAVTAAIEAQLAKPAKAGG